jgi:hypothetical protein
MDVGTVKTGKGNKKLRICTINKRRASRESFETVGTNGMASGKGVLDVLEHKGRVYGIYQEKELVGIYIFEWTEDFFVRVENMEFDGTTKASFKISHVKDFFNLTDDDVDWLYGESKAIYRLTAQHLSAEVMGYKEEIEKDIVADLKEQIEWGQIAGVLMGDTLIYRRQLDPKEKGSSGNTFGYGAGFTIGVIFGWLVFGSMSMGFLWGVCYAMIGGLIFTNHATKQEWITFDFVNPEYVKAEEDQ